MRAHEHELKGDAYMRQFEDTGDQRSLDLAHKHWALANQKQTQERQDRAENRSTATTARTGPGLSFGGVIGVVLAALCALIVVWPTLAFAVGLLMLAAPGFVAGWLTSLADVPGRVRRVDWAHTSTGTRIAVGSLVTAVIAAAGVLAYMLGGDVAGYATFGAVSAPVGYATHHYGLHRRLRRRKTAPVTVRIAPPQAEIDAITASAALPVHDDIAAALPPAYRAAAEAGQVPYPRVDETEHGERITVQLPKGVTSSRFNVEAFAGAYDVPQRRVRLVKARTPGLLVIDVLNTDPESIPMPPWPILGNVTPDAYDDVPVGVEMSSGEPIAASMMLHKGAGAAMAVFLGPQGSGKSLTMRMCAASPILNPDYRVSVLALKGLAPEWYAIRSTVDEYVTTVPDAEASIRRLRKVVEERQQSAIVGNPLLFIIDETEPLKGSAAWADVEYVVKMGRAANVGIWLGSQENTQEASGIPAGLIRQMRTVWLGAGSSNVIANAVQMSMKDEELQAAYAPGMAWLRDRHGKKTLIRTYHVEDEMLRVLGVEADEWDYDEARAAAQGNVHDADSDVQDVLDDERAPSELAAEDLLIEIGDRASLTHDEARKVIGDAKLAILRAALPNGNNGTDDNVKRNGVTVPGIRKERLQRFLNL